MSESGLVDVTGRRRSPAATPGHRAGGAPPNKGVRYPADPPTVEEIILVMREAGPGRYADRTRGLIAILWRAGLRISEALALTETDLDPKTGSVLVRAGKGGKRRMVGMDDWAWEHVARWTEHRIQLPVGPLFCILAGPTRGRGWSATAARGELRRLAAQSGVRRRFAPHQLRHAHAVEMAHEGIALPIIQRQLGHAHLGITSIYLQGIDTREIVDTVHHRRPPVSPASAGLRPYNEDQRGTWSAHRASLFIAGLEARDSAARTRYSCCPQGVAGCARFGVPLAARRQERQRRRPHPAGGQECSACVGGEVSAARSPAMGLGRWREDRGVDGARPASLELRSARPWAVGFSVQRHRGPGVPPPRVRVMATCGQCGIEHADGFRFCPGCGAALAVVGRPRESRKIVTALFCDVTGSTALGEELDPEVLRGVMNRYFAEIRATIERHGGTVEKFIGDAVMAVFGIPRVHEDDALRAVRAAAEIRERMPEVGAEVGVLLRFRTGVNTGPVLVGEGENLAIGDAVNVAARLEQAAEPGEIVLGAETWRLVRDAVVVEALEPLSLKGKSEPAPAFRLLSVDPAAPGVARHLDVPLVGRERELGLLRRAWRRTVDEAGCHLFTLLGPAGVGKSRLVAEVLSSVGDGATVLRGRCLHYGEGITFWPLVEALAPVGEPAQQVLKRLSTGGSARPEELFWEVRRLLESLAFERPVILHVDDLQWAEEMLVELLDHVIDLSRGLPILVLCTARPELLEDRPGWGGGKLNVTTVLLEPLGTEESELLLDQLGDRLDSDARERVITASAGNPLFLEEMATLARERGTVEVPPTIQALMAARLERLAVEERELLERGAVEGEVFHRLAVRALVSERLAAQVESRLAGLVRKELIRPHLAQLYGDDAFRFRHLLIRDAAYDGLPKAIRAELHERFAVWMEDHATGMVELDEIAGWHLEQAVRYGRELGRAAEPALARRAAERLLAAGRRARNRGDITAARNLLERAYEIAPADDRLRVRIGVELAEELTVAGELSRADELLSGGEQDSETALAAGLTRLEWLNNARPDGAEHRIQSLLPEMLEQLAERGDERGLAKAHMASFWAHWGRSQALPAARELRLAAEHAARAGDNGLRERALGWLVAALLWGPFDAGTMSREVEALEREQHAGPFLKASLALLRGEIARLRGDLDEALAITSDARDQYGALGGYVMVGGSDQLIARLHLLAGHPARARDLLLSSDAAFERVGDRGFRSTTLAMLAQVREVLGDHEDARAAIELCEEVGGQDDVINYAITHAVRARLALAEKDSEAADRWARSAVDRAFETDFPFARGEALVTLALVLEKLDRRQESMTAARRALELYEAKCDRPGASQARLLLERLDAVA